MLILRDWCGKEIQVPEYTWDAGLIDFKCELKDVDIGLITEAVKGGGSWISTSPSATHPHNVDIEICDSFTGKIIHFKCFVWESWDAKGNSVKITGRYWGEPNTWKGYKDYVRDED